jgi:fructose/tagatose bisphosphate aldolase
MAERAIVVHCLADAEAALAAAAEAEAPVILLSAAGAAAYGGIGWFAALAREAGRRRPDARVRTMLDCGERPDLVQAAFRDGFRDVVFTGRKAVADRLADIAGQWGARLHRRRPKALDLLGAAEPLAAARAWLARG